jgi:hypothetical protein
MSRINETCPEDCASCALLEDGKVDMFPCILDQIFMRTRRMEKRISDLTAQIESMTEHSPVVPSLAATGDND